MAHTALRVLKLLEKRLSGSRLEFLGPLLHFLFFPFTRIDVSQNDLPWEFMVDRLPTVLFFPCNR